MGENSNYGAKRRALLGACAWDGWSQRKGYSPTAGTTRKENQRALAALRQARKAVM